MNPPRPEFPAPGLPSARRKHCEFGYGVAAAAMVSLITGCVTDTTSVRIKEKSAVFAKLTPEQQWKVSTGRIAIGNTREMVYMALGKPNQVVSSADGRQIAWTYIEYRGTPDEEIVLQNRHAVVANIMDGSKMVFTDGAPVRGRSTVTTLASSGQMGPGDAGKGWQTVMGAEDLERGDVTIPDPTIRPKTAIERAADIESQDLVLTFLEGIVVAIEYERR